MRRIVAICAVAMMIGWEVPAWPQMGGMLGEGPPGMQEMPPGFFGSEGPLITIILSHGQELGLTPDQIQKLQALRTTFEREAVPRSVDIRSAETALSALLERDQWDLPAIEAKVKQIASLQGDLRVARIKTLAAGRALLTPEQLQTLRTIAQWTPPPGVRERVGPRQPYGPGGPGPRQPGPGGPPPPPQ